MSQFIKLVPSPAARQDLLRALETMLEDARHPDKGRPRLIGFAGVLIYEGGHVALDMVGEAERRPDLSLAYWAVLYDDLRDMVRERLR